MQKSARDHIVDSGIVCMCAKKMKERFLWTVKEKAPQKSSLDHIAIDIDFVAITLLLEGFRQHKLAHPIDPLVAALDGKMMRLPRRSAKNPLLLRGRNELETESGSVGMLLLLAAAELESFERGAEFGGGEGGAGDGVVVDVDVFEGVDGLGVFVHGEAGAVEPEVVFVPFVTEHFRFALLHPAGVADAFDARRVGRG